MNSVEQNSATQPVQGSPQYSYAPQPVQIVAATNPVQNEGEKPFKGVFSGSVCAYGLIAYFVFLALGVFATYSAITTGKFNFKLILIAIVNTLVYQKSTDIFS